MIIAVPTEGGEGERRLALVPEAIARLTARAGAWISDDDYRRADAKIEASPGALLGAADVIVKIRAPRLAEADLIREGRF